MKLLKFGVIAALLALFHVAFSIAVAFLIDLYSFPTGMSRSSGSVYLSALETMHRLLGLPLQMNRNRSHYDLGLMCANSVLAATLVCGFYAFVHKFTNHSQVDSNRNAGSN